MPRTHTDEFRNKAVERVNGGESIIAVAKELGIASSLLGNWKRKINSGEGFTDRKTYDEAYKRAAVARLLNEPAQAIADDLGIHHTMVREWKKKFEGAKPKPHGKARKSAPPVRRSYTAAYKARVVARVNKGEGVSKVSKALGLSTGMVSNWVHGGREKAKPTRKKKSYYVKVADRVPTAATVPLFDKSAAPDPGKRAMAIQTCIVMLKRLRPQFDTSDPVHLTAALVLATLEGKM